MKMVVSVAWESVCFWEANSRKECSTEVYLLKEKCTFLLVTLLKEVSSTKSSMALVKSLS